MTTTLKRSTSVSPVAGDDIQFEKYETQGDEEDADGEEEEEGAGSDDDEDNSGSASEDEDEDEEDFAFSAADDADGSIHRALDARSCIDNEAVESDEDGTGAIAKHKRRSKHKRVIREVDDDEPTTSDKEFIDDRPRKQKWTKEEKRDIDNKKRKLMEKHQAIFQSLYKEPLPSKKKSSSLPKPKQKPSSSNGLYADVLSPIIKKETKQLGVVKVPDKYMHLPGFGKKVTQLQLGTTVTTKQAPSMKAKVATVNIDVRTNSKKAKPKKADALRAEARQLGKQRRGEVKAEDDDDDKSNRASSSSSSSDQNEDASPEYKHKQDLVDNAYTSTLSTSAASLLLYPAACIKAETHVPKPAPGCLYQLGDVFTYDGVEYTVTKPFLKPTSCKQRKSKSAVYDLSDTSIVTRDHLLTAHREELDIKSQSHYHFFVANQHFTPLMVGKTQSSKIMKRSLRKTTDNLGKDGNLKGDKKQALDRLALANDNLKYYNQGSSAEMVELILHPEVYKELRIDASMKKIQADTSHRYSYACHPVMDILTLQLVGVNTQTLKTFLTRADKMYKKAEEVLYASLSKNDPNYSIDTIADFEKSLNDEYNDRVSKSTTARGVNIGQFILEQLICFNILTSGRSPETLQRRFFRAHLLDHQLPALDEEEVEAYQNLDLEDLYDNKPAKGRMASDPTQQPHSRPAEEGSDEEADESEEDQKPVVTAKALKKKVSLHASEPKRKKLKKMKAEVEAKVEEAEPEHVDPYAEDEAAAREAREMDDIDLAFPNDLC